MKFRYLAAVSVVAMMASGCTATSTVMPGEAVIDSPKEAPLRADVNPGYKAGQVDFKTEPAKSLDQIKATKITPKKTEEVVKKDGDKLRAPAMQETALSYGSRSGLAYETARINKRLEAAAATMQKTYNFQGLMIQGPNNTMVRPPIISEAVDAYETFDAGKTLRIADTVYEIIEQSQFSPVAPMWQSYLITRFDDAEAPPEQIMPQTEEELADWNKWIAEGFDKGRQQARDIFQANLDRLNRDFTGMVRYRELLEEGKVSRPILAGSNLGVTGTGQDMRVNDHAFRISAEPTLQVKPKGWEASPTTTDAAGDPTGPAATPKAVEKPVSAEKTAEKKVVRKYKSKPKPKPVATSTTSEKTSGGDNRF